MGPFMTGNGSEEANRITGPLEAAYKIGIASNRQPSWKMSVRLGFMISFDGANHTSYPQVCGPADFKGPQFQLQGHRLRPSLGFAALARRISPRLVRIG